MKKPVFELEARAERFLPDDLFTGQPDAWLPAEGPEMCVHVRRGRQCEFFADAVPDVLRDSWPESLSLGPNGD